MNGRQRRRLEEARRWFDQAAEDLKSAELLLEGERFYLVCFLAQQIAEKALKGFLYGVGEQKALGHGVDALCRWCAEYDDAFADLRADVAILDTYYIATRYPNGLVSGIPATTYNGAAAEGALALARRALDFAHERAVGRASGDEAGNGV